MKLLRLTLRDLFCLILACALAMAWMMDRHHLGDQIADAKALKLLRERKQRYLATKKVDAKLLSHVRAKSDAALSAHLGDLIAKEHVDDIEYDVHLAEMAKRRMADKLHRHYQALMSTAKIHSHPVHIPQNLALLTALRRAQGKPDPLLISAEWERPILASSTSLPILDVTIKNVDVEQEWVMYEHRNFVTPLDQFQIRLVDENGRAATAVDCTRFPHDGRSSSGFLDYGKSKSYKLELRDYVQCATPGKYRLYIYYHNLERIADCADFEELIVCRSPPIDFVVEPLTIRLTKHEHETARRLLKEIDMSKQVKVVAGTYGRWAHGFVSPSSAQGQLLSLEQKAVPALMEAVGQKNLSERRTAWLLSLLFSVTGEYDPRGDAGGNLTVLPDHHYLLGNFQAWGSDQEAAGKWRGEERESLGRRVDRQEQSAFVRRWQQWYKRVDVKIE